MLYLCIQHILDHHDGTVARECGYLHTVHMCAWMPYIVFKAFLTIIHWSVECGHLHSVCVCAFVCVCVCTLLVYICTYPLPNDSSCQRMFALLLNYYCMSVLYTRFHRGGLLHIVPQSHQRQPHHHPPCFQGHDHWPSPGWQDCSASPPPRAGTT